MTDKITDVPEAPAEAVSPSGINHLVLNVRDIDESDKFWTEIVGVNHGVTHSVYINDPNGYGVEFLYEMPREMWENDIDGGVNWLENLPSEGPEALVDRTDTPSFGQKAAAE